MTTTLAKDAVVQEAQVDGPSIVLVLEGEVEIEGDGKVSVAKGQVAFVAAETRVSVQNVGDAEAKVARAFVEP